MQKKTKVYVGMDVHKDTVMMAVLPEGAREPTLVKQLSHDPRGTSSLFGPGGSVEGCNSHPGKPTDP